MQPPHCICTDTHTNIKSWKSCTSDTGKSAGMEKKELTWWQAILIYSHFQTYILWDTGVLLPMRKYMVNNQPFLFVCDRRTAEMANNQIKVAITKPQDRGKSGLSKKAAESTRSHNRHRELKGNGGFLSLVCSFSLHSGERERSPCLWTRNAGQRKVCTRCVAVPDVTSSLAQPLRSS